MAHKYFKGDGVPQDLDKALEIIEKADTKDLFDKDKNDIIRLIKSNST